MCPPSAYLVSNSESPEAEVEASDMQDHQNNLLYQGLGELDERSQDIIRSRWLSENKATLQTMADRYGVSAERNPPVGSQRDEQDKSKFQRLSQKYHYIKKASILGAFFFCQSLSNSGICAQVPVSSC